MAKISVLGAGSWGTALSILLYNNGHEVILWSALGEEITTLREKREHVSKLPGVKIPEPIDITTDIERSLRDADVAILAVPSPYTRSTCKRMAPFVKNGQKIVNVAKGVEEKTLLTLSEIIEQELPQANVSVLSGPSHAEEVGKGLPTTCVVSSHQRETAEYLQGIFMSPVFRVYTTPDMLGVELGAALKNVIALAAGTADGLGYGDNTKAALITRGIAEISRLGVKMGARMETFYGLSGIGDLIVTCASVHSRNRKAGYLMGKGYTMEQAMAEVKMIVEGVYSAKAAKELAEKYGQEVLTMVGFLDGINDSLKIPNPIETMDENTKVSLCFDKELLYKNMVDARADWLYELPQWDAIFTPEKRKELYLEQKKSGTVVKAKKIGRNDPCPCGSGKKYKYCCGKNA